MKFFQTHFTNSQTGLTVLSEIFTSESNAKDLVSQVETESKGLLIGNVTNN